MTEVQCDLPHRQSAFATIEMDSIVCPTALLQRETESKIVEIASVAETTIECHRLCALNVIGKQKQVGIHCGAEIKISGIPRIPRFNVLADRIPGYKTQFRQSVEDIAIARLHSFRMQLADGFVRANSSELSQAIAVKNPFGIGARLACAQRIVFHLLVGLPRGNTIGANRSSTTGNHEKARNAQNQGEQGT